MNMLKVQQRKRVTTIYEIQTLLSKIFKILVATGYVEPIPVEFDMLVKNNTKRCIYHQGIIGHDIKRCSSFQAKM